MMDDNELRNLYRKNGIYKIYTTLKNETHIFAVFKDLEKAILYRDLFESSNWNLNLKGITDMDNPVSSEIIIKNDESVDSIDEKEELESINELLEENNTPQTTAVDEINEIDELLNEPQNNTIQEEELSEIDDLIKEESNDEKLEEVTINELEDEIENDININEDDSVNKNPTTDMEITEEDSNETELEIKEDIEDEEPDESFDVQHIYYNHNVYYISKLVNGNLEHFGTYKTVDEAIAARDYFRDHNWNLADKEKFKVKNENQYIHKNKQGFFEIKKYIDNKQKYFGRYYKLEDAKKVRDYLENNNWDEEKLSQFKDLQVVTKRKNNNKNNNNPKRYIHKENTGKYKIIKRINDEIINFGIYEDIEDAKTARDYFEDHGWNIDDREKFKDKEYTYKYGKNNPQRYICKTDDRYVIRKNNVYFASFDTLEEAIEARDFLEEHDFSLEYKDKFRKESKIKKTSKNYFENMELF